jgi:hypothetical protein
MKEEIEEYISDYQRLMSGISLLEKKLHTKKLELNEVVGILIKNNVNLHNIK